MMKSPGQRNPWVENCSAAQRSRRTSISARVGSRTQRRDRLQLSSPILSDEDILAQADWEHAEDYEAIEGRQRAGRGTEDEADVVPIQAG